MTTGHTHTGVPDALFSVPAWYGWHIIFTSITTHTPRTLLSRIYLPRACALARPPRGGQRPSPATAHQLFTDQCPPPASAGARRHPPARTHALNSRSERFANATPTARAHLFWPYVGAYSSTRGQTRHSPSSIKLAPMSGQRARTRAVPRPPSLPPTAYH